MAKKKKYKTLEEIQNNPVWIKLQLNGTSKEQLDQQSDQEPSQKSRRVCRGKLFLPPPVLLIYHTSDPP